MTRQDDVTKIFSISGGNVYDVVYGDKPYAAEASFLNDVISSRKRSPGAKLLDLACGTARHSRHLQHLYQVSGVDIAKEQIELARIGVPDGDFIVGDMRDFHFDHKFDAILCMFSSIAYLHPYSEFEKAIGVMTRHLEPGGVIIVEPWVKKTDWAGEGIGTQRNFTLEDGGRLTRVIERSSVGDLSTLTMRFTHHAKGHASTTSTEVHEMAFCNPIDYEKAFHKYGLEAEYIEDELFSRGLFIATKQL